MDKAWNVLEELGAIDADGHLTALGRHIVRDHSHISHADLQICSFISQCSLWTCDWERSVDKMQRVKCHFDNATQMLVLGTVFQCLNPILTVVGCLSSKPIFISPMNKRDEANQ